MQNLFSVDNVFFTFLSYPMSYIEFFGTIFYAVSIILVARKNILTWPIGLVGVVLYMVLFFQIQLYSDFFEQLYYLVTGFYGWYIWKKKSGKESNGLVRRNSKKENIRMIILILVLTLIMTFVVINLNDWLPSLFKEEASYPLLDALTTVMSFVAQILMSHKKIENWILWIIVDVIGIWLYFEKEVKFLSVLYFAFLILAISGFHSWYKELSKDK